MRSKEVGYDLKLDGVTKIQNNSGAINIEIEKLPKVNGITVNTSHGNDPSIKKVVDRFHPIVESMEGAAFMFACENERIPYVQIRAVSNFVEKRNKDKWNIPLAIENLNKNNKKVGYYFTGSLSGTRNVMDGSSFKSYKEKWRKLNDSDANGIGRRRQHRRARSHVHQGDGRVEAALCLDRRSHQGERQGRRAAQR